MAEKTLNISRNTLTQQNLHTSRANIYNQKDKSNNKFMNKKIKQFRHNKSYTIKLIKLQINIWKINYKNKK